MRSVFQDLRYGTRAFLKDPGFTAVAVLTLALGIAANTTVFSWIENVLVRPLPGVGDGRRLVVLEIVTPGFNQGTVNLSYDEYRLARENLKLLSGIAAHTLSAFHFGDGQGTQRVWGELVSGNYFSLLRVQPLLGTTRALHPGAFEQPAIQQKSPWVSYADTRSHLSWSPYNYRTESPLPSA